MCTVQIVIRYLSDEYVALTKSIVVRGAGSGALVPLHQERSIHRVPGLWVVFKSMGGEESRRPLLSCRYWRFDLDSVGSRGRGCRRLLRG